MENKERIIELFLGLIFIALLLVACAIVLTQDSKKTSNVISNSYNTNSYNNYENTPEIIRTTKPVYIEKNYLEKVDYLDYSSYGKHIKKKDFVGSYVDEFKVYVTNKDFQNGYFKVVFHFENYSGEEFSESITHYIRSGEEKEFRFIDVQFEKYLYDNWYYKVISETKVSETNSGKTVFYDFPNGCCCR